MKMMSTSLLLSFIITIIPNNGGESPKGKAQLSRPLIAKSQRSYGTENTNQSNFRSMPPHLLPQCIQFMDKSSLHNLATTNKMMNKCCHNYNNHTHWNKQELFEWYFNPLIGTNTRLTIEELMQIKSIFLQFDDYGNIINYFKNNPDITTGIGIGTNNVSKGMYRGMYREHYGFIVFHIKPINNIEWYHLFANDFSEMKFPPNTEYFMIITRCRLILISDNDYKFSRLPWHIEVTQIIEKLLKNGEVKLDGVKWILSNKRETCGQKFINNQHLMRLISNIKCCCGIFWTSICVAFWVTSAVASVLLILAYMTEI